MIGSFIQTRKAINPEEAKPGTPIVAIKNGAAFEKAGIINGIRFGIVSEWGMVIYVHWYHNRTQAFGKKSRGEIVRLPLGHFCPKTWALYTYDEETHGSAQDAKVRAEQRLGEYVHADASQAGDDFVYEVLTGKTMLQYMAEHPEIGTKYWTPLNFPIPDAIKFMARNAIANAIANGIRKFPWIKNWMLEWKHYGLRIESNQVIHFSLHRMRDGKNRIKTDSFEAFCNTSPCEESGGEEPWPDSTPEARLRARNTAVGILTHKKGWGRYSLFKNNCEHFVNYCCTGEKTSSQVSGSVIQVSSWLALNAVFFMIPGGAPVRLTRTLIQVLSTVFTIREISTTQNKTLPL